MYTNFIFDMGNVLMDFSPDYILSRYTDNPLDIESLKETIFGGSLWSQLDNGDRFFADVCEEILEQVPTRLHAVCRDFFATWQNHKVPRTDMLEIIKDLKAKGYGIYLCSNAASLFHTYKDKYEVFSYFDHLTISADIGISKPDLGIYEYVLKENNLDAKTCLFVDDLGPNIKAAKACGIAGYLYNGNAALFRTFLKTIKVL